MRESIIGPKEGKNLLYGGNTLSDLPDNQCSRCVKINKINGHIAIATNEGRV